MSECIATAPGKLILLGEYAVLEGAPAVVMAVNRRAKVSVRHNAEHNLVVAPQICDRYLPFRRDENGAVLWGPLDDATRGRLGLLSHLVERFVPVDEPVQLEADTAAFYDEGIKLGFGSSAALTVAAAAALRGEPGRLPELVELHREIQDGRGSGFDVAASRLGGVCRYRFRPLPAGEPMQLPTGLHIRCVWTGNAASTTAFLRGLDALGPRRKALQVLVQTAERVVSGLDEQATGWEEAVREYAAGLQQFARATTLPIFSGGHAEVMQLAEQHRVAYKPSGAGGGDIGVVVSASAGALQDFQNALHRTPMQIVAADTDSSGLELSSE